MQCWCQLGNIECRHYMGTFLENLYLFADSKIIYMVVTVISVAFIFGLVLCCGLTLSFYYYYYNHQDVFQDVFDQYFNSGGWQTVEEEVAVDINAEEKRLEAEESQVLNPTVDSVPPPYTTYDEPCVLEEESEQT